MKVCIVPMSQNAISVYHDDIAVVLNQHRGVSIKGNMFVESLTDSDTNDVYHALF